MDISERLEELKKALKRSSWKEEVGDFDLVMSIDHLPKELRSPGGSGDPKEILKSFGVKFIGIEKENPLFYRVVLPIGWSKKYEVGSFWFGLVDEKCREHAVIFKRGIICFLTLVTRFRIETDLVEGIVQITDGGKDIVWSSKVECENEDEKYVIFGEILGEANKWLLTHYPDWQNPSKYWD